MSWLRYVPVWKADVAVLDEPWRGAEAPRAMLLVMGERNVVYRKVLPATKVNTVRDAARALYGAVRAVAARVRGFPRTLVVGDWAVAELVGRKLRRRGVDVRVSPSLREVRWTIRRLARLLDEPDVAWDLIPLDPWDEDGIDPGLAEAVYPAAARLWRARPWDRMPDEEPLRVWWRGRESVIVLSHPRGHGHVVTLFTDARDYENGDFGGPESPVVGIRFVERADVPRMLRRQIAAHGWEVAAPAAYPILVGDRPGFGRPDVAAALQELVAAVQALAAWAEERRPPGAALPFVHADTGVELRPAGDAEPVPWPAMRRARLAGALSAAAGRVAPEGAAERTGNTEARRVDAFAAHLGVGGTRRGLVDRYVEHAAEWARFLDRRARLTAQAATEYDLRLFLYEWYPRHARGSEDQAERMPASLRRYFGWLQEREGIAYPWADAVLRERRAFLERMETAPLGRDDAGEDGGLARWRDLLFRDLDARVLLRDRGFPDPALEWWEKPPSPRVAALAEELQRLWLCWRDDAVAAGVTAPGPLRAALLARQREWERTAHPRFGMSPLRVAAEDDGSPAG